MRKAKKWFVPVTPAGTPIAHLASSTEQEAIKKLLIEASHMPYKTWDNFKKRGYTIKCWDFKP